MIRVELTGGLDIATVSEVDRVLQSTHDSLLVIDLRRLSFMGVAGLRMVVETQKRQNKSGGRLVVVRGPAQVQRVFELTGTSDWLEMVGDPSEILEAPLRVRCGASGARAN